MSVTAEQRKEWREDCEQRGIHDVLALLDDLDAAEAHVTRLIADNNAWCSKLAAAEAEVERLLREHEKASQIIQGWEANCDAARAEIATLKGQHVAEIMGLQDGSALRDARALAEALSLLQSLLCNVAQLLDGWHNDGTTWTEWDESVRQRVSEVMLDVHAALARPGVQRLLGGEKG